jgi:hypothetical protein
MMNKYDGDRKQNSGKIFKSIGCTIAILLGIIFMPNWTYAEIEPRMVISPESIRFHHQALVDISTKAGGLDSGIRLNKAGEEAAEYLLNGFKKAGLKNVRFEPFYPNRWWPEKYSVTLIGDSGEPDQKLNAFPLWHCERADNLELEVVYAGFGTTGEFRGLDIKNKAVLIDMTRLLHFIASYRVTKALDKIKENGAKAVIVAETRIDSPSGNSVGDVGKINNQKAKEPDLYPLPVFSISKSDGKKLKDRVKAGTTKVRLNLQYTLAPGKANNVIAELPGNGNIDETIIIGGHYDTWFDGAIDNLGSQASLLEMARYFSRIPQADRDRHLMFVSLFGHELGNHAMGHTAFAEKRTNILGKITCFFNIDGSGSWGWEEKGDTGDIYATNKNDKGGIFSSSLALSALAHKAIYRHSPGTWVQMPLNFFVADLHKGIAETGMPVLLVISKHIYYHSIFDTLDRISPGQVYQRSLVNIDIINNLMKSPPGYYMSVDTNPHRILKEGETPKQDLTLDQLPTNPKPWQTGPPAELAIHVIPNEPNVFSPVIVWGGYWTSDAILRPDGASWDFGGILGLKGPKKAFYGGTMYFFPGKKQISMTVTDSRGRSTTISREFKVKAGKYAFAYWLCGIMFCVLIFIGFRYVVRKRKTS